MNVPKDETSKCVITPGKWNPCRLGGEEMRDYTSFKEVGLQKLRFP
jgi:hypothetical protein